MRIERELMRGAGPVTVLRLLRQREMYGYQLVQSLSSRADGVLAMGQSTLYPLLYSLEAKGLIKGQWRELPSGRKRKYYGLTAKGKARLKAEQAQWRRLLRAMTSLGLLDPSRLEP
jgi:PadR family transcriptional regulator PadR